MSRTVSASGNNVRNAVAAAKRLLGNSKLRISSSTDHGDGLHRVVLTSSDVIEVTVKARAKCEAVEVQ